MKEPIRDKNNLSVYKIIIYLYEIIITIKLQDNLLKWNFVGGLSSLLLAQFGCSYSMKDVVVKMRSKNNDNGTS